MHKLNCKPKMQNGLLRFVTRFSSLTFLLWHNVMLSVTLLLDLLYLRLRIVQFIKYKYYLQISKYYVILTLRYISQSIQFQSFYIANKYTYILHTYYDKSICVEYIWSKNWELARYMARFVVRFVAVSVQIPCLEFDR